MVNYGSQIERRPPGLIPTAFSFIRVVFVTAIMAKDWRELTARCPVFQVEFEQTKFSSFPFERVVRILGP